MEFFTFKNKSYKVISDNYAVGDLVAEFNMFGTKVIDIFVAEYIYPKECIISKIKEYE